MVTEVDSDQAYSFLDGSGATLGLNGIAFNPDGTKMFVSAGNGSSSPHRAGDGDDFINEYNLPTPFDISTAVYAGDSARCDLTGTIRGNIGDMVFSSDGLKIFTVTRGTNGSNRDLVYRYDLTAPYDVSTCVYVANVNPDTTAIQDGWRYGSLSINNNHVQGIEINPDGTKIFLSFNDVNNPDSLDGIREYTLSTPYDLSTISQVDNAGILLTQSNPDAIFFSANGKRIFVTDHDLFTVAQYSLSKAYDTSSYVKDGEVNIKNLIKSVTADQTRALAFSAAGLKMFVSDDRGSDDDTIHEFDLVCPFNIIEGKCPAIAKGDRTGLAIAQIEVATRTIEHSTDTALNRLKWIRRNKDNQNLTNLNLDLNFTNPMLVSLAKVVKNSATSKKTKDQNQEQEQEQDIFFWSEGSIAVGRVGETKVSSFKKFKTDAITVGADKFTKNNGITGLAFRFGKDDVEVGSAGSNLDTDTYNLTHYTSSPIKDDTKFIDTVIGVGALNFDILSVLDGQRVTAKRDGKQIYGTIKLKDEIKKNNLILIPSGQVDLGYTLLNDYQESGNAAMKFKKQGVQSRNARLSIAAAEELENEKYKIRKHGKLEYKANLHRSSSIKYSYLADTTSNFDTKLYSGALHNLNGELGVDIILPDSFSIFLIYERNQALEVGHTDKIHLAIGFLPNKKTNYAYKLAGSENLGSEFKISKNINDFQIDFTLNNQDALRPNTIEEATINLTSKF
ncbi:autotransporter outer membrane beta-barrel domain-containing protein [Candidatus Pelagibacter sp. IMCC9063]|uniref:autotransporter outer membrane beta-barrel domain-containing protein n=1 Tax=Pelagibacter sp. (strain IMCC9063) TaxID=1002672 RepID=UPI001F35CFDA|nr:autotransporter outer membrane beta-barrel domain-containing protein [Candidatus Pelagibacter sp. IMCC9063]